ncbi:MSHA biogenesis protein MshE [Thioalkalivibrio denitrificans]|uniref:MSHA biogenesis protein MshE n=1 Tax=Thioalkalivibrio denitrificans TaxID=108003 RepID=A0A1V3NP49_9GAMM|nr:GspE/PulE family protein [Thioalkalivibrio denitrificans]OOG26784.1 MSHA biogenesis protein MshE [Thioalkalivibrio denitrificans]
MSTPAPETRKKIRLGDLLVENGIISKHQLDQALATQKQTGNKLGRTLIELGFIDEESMLQLLSRQLAIPLVDLRHYRFDRELILRLPETAARRFRCIPLAEQGDGYLVGMADPTDIFAFDEVNRLLGRPVYAAVVRESDLLRTFDSVYRRTEEISDLAEELGQELAESDFDAAQLAAGDEVTDAPVVKLLQSLFEDAVQVSASDIHIEPDENALRIRQRIDGVLQEQVMKEKRIANAVVLRLKLMAGLNISEKRLPQDGRFNIKVKGRNIDVRLSTMPIQHGESVVMRLLDQSTGMLELEHLGMPRELMKCLRRVLRHPSGMVLVTGPTGSGKTTTLYAALQELNIPDRKIITVEDPVEYRLPRINQVQVNARIGLEFATVLRAALRQDPDVVLVGEMRDRETAEIGLRAAMTGHLVLSTLHTNDAIATADRLLDMGAQGFLLASSLRAVIAQRLVRRVCESCTEPHTPDAQQASWIVSVAGESADLSRLQRGRGCTHCNNTGYRGRIGVYEYLEPDEAMLSALRRSHMDDFARAAHANRFYRPLMNVALEYALAGVTSLDEAQRLAGEVEGRDLNGGGH